MQRLNYAGNSVLTGTAIAHALLGYARALAANNTSDTVVIPIIDEDDNLTTAEFLVGPASQLVAEQVESARPEIIDDELVHRIEKFTRSLDTPRAIPARTTDESKLSDFDRF